jgi:hypothetical protein
MAILWTWQKLSYLTVADGLAHADPAGALFAGSGDVGVVGYNLPL